MIEIVPKIKDIRKKHGLRKGLKRLTKLYINRVFFNYSKQDLKGDLNALGILRGDIIFVHSALSKIGYVKGGAPTIIKALMEVVSEEGTILMPAYPMRGNAYKYVSKNHVFDVRKTTTGSGTIPEIFRTFPGTLRSLHPTHSVCAWGKDAQYFIEEHEKQVGPFGFGTPFYKFIERGGKGLILGAKLGNFTVLRCIEDIRKDYPYFTYCDKVFRLKVIDYKGNEFFVNTKVHNAIADPYRDVDGLLLPLFKKDGMVRVGKVGKAISYLVQGKGLFEYMEDLLSKGITPWKEAFPAFPG
ncbi:MAG: AAC(3) family N-acetyltransferase [bacterium]